MFPPMPFLTGPEPGPHLNGDLDALEPGGRLTAIMPLSRVQQPLWFDYLRRPLASHYHLTLKVDLSMYNVTLEMILQTIYKLSSRHSMLRTTFHLDTASDDVSKSYMAIHCADEARQNIDIITDHTKLHATLRRAFNLTSEFPLRWVLAQQISVEDKQLRSRYTIYIVAHHIAIDGSGMSQLSKEILEELDTSKAAAHDGADEVIDSAFPYGDYSQRQTAFLKSPEGLAAREFWKSQLSNTYPITWTLPTPDHLPSSTSYRQIETWAHFTKNDLRAWSEIYNTSWFRIVATIVGLVVNGNSVATPHHDQALLIAFGGRPTKHNTSISHMANTMPVKVPISSLSRDANFSDLVKQFSRSMSVAKRHEYYPFISLVDEINRARDTQQLDLKVSVTFSPQLAKDNCTLYPVEGVWDLFFCFLEQVDGVSLGVISDPKVLSQDSLRKMKGEFLDTVERSRRDAKFDIFDLEYIRGRGRARLASGPSMVQYNEISAGRVHDWIKAQASVQPQGIALEFAERGTHMTYEELASSSSQIANWLHYRGICPGDAILLHLKRDFNIVLWILGVLEAGACFIVLEKSLPARRKQAIIRTSEASLLVTDEALLKEEWHDSGAISVIHTADANTAIANQPTTPLTVSVADNELAYIVYTSGSTGEPKGVMVEHSNLSHYVSAARQHNRLGQNSNVLQFATFAFDASILEWAVTLSYGATLCFVEYPQLLVGDYLADMICRSNINFFHTTPSVLSTIPVHRSLPSLRVISVGGEASSAGLLDRWRQRLELLHAYGPTETTVIVTTEVIPEDRKGASDAPSPSIIGKAFTNSEIIICDERDLDPLPAGTVGEICVVGPQVARGYRGQEELTKAKFFEINHGGRAQRLYRTGDRGFITPDEKLSILGRMASREVKVRGYRVDLYEIEKSILDNCPNVTLASVQVQDNILVAYVVPATSDCDHIRRKLKMDIPIYSIPSKILAMNSLPLNANGKVDHTRVAASMLSEDRTAKLGLDISKISTCKGDVQDPSQGEVFTGNFYKTLGDIITQLWMQTLGLSKPPDRDTTFYEAGGHSILLTTLHKSLVSKFPTSGLRLLEVFQLPTIEKQVQRLSEAFEDQCSGTHLPPDSLPSRAEVIATTTGTVPAPEDKFAIIGMAGRFPGADTVDDFWDLLISQREGITTMSEIALDPNRPLLSKDEMFVPRWGAINGIESFDRKIWGMTEAETKTMDPQKIIFLDVAAEALNDAGIKLDKGSENSIGTFVGAAANTFQYDSSTPLPESTFEARHRTVLDPNISTFAAYKLNLTGPNMTLNTACSSSITALHTGLNSLKAGDCETALIGGTSVVYPKEGGYVTCPGQVFSPSGVCRPLDSCADGSVPADAIAALVIKPLRKALLDKDRIYSIIEGCAIGTDGAVNKTGFPVPSSEGQSRTVAAAIRSSGVGLEHIKYVELHGSGTLLGDALEVDGLNKAFELMGHQRGSPKIRVGSNKGNFGNAETASGMLSLIKASVALDKAVVPPLRHLGEPSHECDLETRFIPITCPLELDKDDRIGVTSLGYGGSNAHVILASPKAFKF